MRGYKIELLMKIGEGSLSFNPANDARNIEQLSRRAKERFGIGVEAENVVAEKLANVKEVTRAAAKVENVQWRRPIEPKILRAFDVDLDPVSDILEPIDLGRAWPIRKFVSQVSKLEPVDVVQNPTLVDGMRPAAEMFGSAGEELGRKKFPELA